ncbi:MAG: tRNA dimethylallyltransferase [Bacteroidales bacterium]|nr:tRNA dimethylallyltransferase [Bacteroidales bacterium]
MPKTRKTLPAELPDPEQIDLEALAADCLDGKLKLICVLGPTASGKTRYAVRLAEELAGKGLSCEIISADSRQVYRGMDIGTGKDLAEYGGVPYHLIDIADPGTQYNVHSFCRDFEAAAADIRSRGAFPILCGGTGLYISAATGDYDFSNRKPLSAAASDGQHDGVFFIGTLVSREDRNAKIDARLRARLKEGMVDEIRGLLDGSSPACKAGGPVPAEVLLGYGLEYKFVTLYLQGQLSEEELFLQLSTAIHQFAKRQMTWFRGMERSGIRIHWVTP